MGCCCGKAADPPPELVGRWARDPHGSFRGFKMVRRAAYQRTVQGYVSVNLGAANELLEIPERGLVRHVETFGGGSYTSWAGPVLEWAPPSSLGAGEYTTTTGCCGTLESVGKARDIHGHPWMESSGVEVHSIEINCRSRLFRVRDCL